MKLKDKIGDKLSHDVETIFYGIDKSFENFCTFIKQYNLPPHIFGAKLNQYIKRKNEEIDIELIYHSQFDYEFFIKISIDNTILFMNLEIKLIYDHKKWIYEYNTVILTDSNGVILYDIGPI